MHMPCSHLMATPHVRLARQQKHWHADASTGFEASKDPHLSKRLSRKGMAGGLPWRRAISAFMR